MDKHKIFLILWLVAIMLIFASILSPWWYNIEKRQEDTNSEQWRNDWYLTKMKTQYENDFEPDGDWTSTQNLNEIEHPRVGELWLRTFLIVLLALALNFAVLWIYLHYRQLRTTKQWAVTITALATIVSLIIPLIVMFSLPVVITNETGSFYYHDTGEIYSSFWGEDEITELNGVIKMNFEWGPMYGWALFWLVFVLDFFMLLLIAPPPKPTEANTKKAPTGTVE
jgi:amino acid transporter